MCHPNTVNKHKDKIVGYIPLRILKFLSMFLKQPISNGKTMVTRKRVCCGACFAWLGNPIHQHLSWAQSYILICHFRVHLSFYFKARLSAKSLLWKSVFIRTEIGTSYHNQNFALRLALKERLRETRKWSIWINLAELKIWRSLLWNYAHLKRFNFASSDHKLLLITYVVY